MLFDNLRLTLSTDDVFVRFALPDIAEPSLPNDDSDGNDAVVDFGMQQLSLRPKLSRAYMVSDHTGSSDVKDSASGPTPTVSQAKFRSQTSNAAPGNGSPGQLADPTMDIDELTPSKTVNRVLGELLLGRAIVSRPI